MPLKEEEDGGKTEQERRDGAGHDAALVDVKQRLQLDNEMPLVVRHVSAVVLLQRVNTSARNETVQRVGLLKLAAVGRLAAAHFNLDGNRGLSLFADGDLLVFAFNRCSGSGRH